MSPVRLSTFDNRWYHPGRSRLVHALWFFVGAPMVCSTVIPFSSMRSCLLKLFGARIGAGVVLKPGIRIKFPWRLSIGNHSWIGEDCWLDNLEHISVGSNVCISQGAYLCSGNHDWSDASFGLITERITLQDGC